MAIGPQPYRHLVRTNVRAHPPGHARPRMTMLTESEQKDHGVILQKLLEADTR